MELAGPDSGPLIDRPRDGPYRAAYVVFWAFLLMSENLFKRFGQFIEYEMGKSGCYCCVFDISSNKMVTLDPSGARPVCCTYDISANPVTCVLDLSGNGPKPCEPDCCECVCATAFAQAEAAGAEPAAAAAAVEAQPQEPEKKSVVARRMIEEVERALLTESPASVSSRFAEYQLEFPKLFATLLNRDYPRDVLELMIAQIEKVESGRTSQHDASVAVGSVLVNQFVKPQMGLANPN